LPEPRFMAMPANAWLEEISPALPYRDSTAG
jgi:hypothetical protein